MKPLFLLVLMSLVACAAKAQNSWTNFYRGPGNAYGATDVALDTNGNVLVTGSCAAIKYSGAGVPLWTNLFNLSVYSADTADANGNAYVICWLEGTGSNSVYETIKYSGAGVSLWTNIYQGFGNGCQGAATIAVDAGGNPIVTGSPIAGTGTREYATIKYSSAGVPLWTNIYNGPANTNSGSASIAIDTDGNALVTGESAGFDGYIGIATIKYSSEGAPLWTNRYEGQGNGYAGGSQLALDVLGDAVVTGSAIDGTGHNEYVTIKYSNAGVPVWTNFYNGPGGYAYANGISVDARGNACVTGSSTGTNGLHAYTTIEYSSTGMPLWTNFCTGSGNLGAFAARVAVDAAGNFYVTGASSISDNVQGFGTVMYSSGGVPVWTNYFTAFDNGGGNAIAVDANSNVFVTGRAWADSLGDYNYVTIKYAAPALNAPFFIVTPGGNFGFSNGIFGFNYIAPASSYVEIEASSDLVNWVPVITNQPASGPTYFSDQQSPMIGTRFYRALLLP